jgi:hypothetical protein
MSTTTINVKQLDGPNTCEDGNEIESGKTYCCIPDCQACCPHSDERDHGICINCGHEEDPGAVIDKAMDSMEDK